MEDYGKELEQAKKRNNKVKITNIAISKVPYIEYKNMTEEQNLIMQKLARSIVFIAEL